MGVCSVDITAIMVDMVVVAVDMDTVVKVEKDTKVDMAAMKVVTVDVVVMVAKVKNMKSMVEGSEQGYLVH